MYQLRLFILLVALLFSVNEISAHPFEIEHTHSKKKAKGRSRSSHAKENTQKPRFVQGKKKLKVEVEGKRGHRGRQGIMGPIGHFGPTGPTGPVGDRGPAGPNGEVGSIGLIGPTGPMGPTGATGSTGSTGSTGPGGPAGPSGAIGPAGPASPENFIAPNNLFVDQAAPVGGNGNINSPFKTIQAALNAIGAATTPQAFQRGTTIIIASGIYDENLTVNVDQKRITLLGLGSVILGGTSNAGAIQITATPANTPLSGLQSSLTISSLASLDKNTSALSSQSPIGASNPTFVINGHISITNNSPALPLPNLGAIQVLLNADISTSGITTSGNANLVNLLFYNANVHGPITGDSQSVLLIGEKTTFEQLVTVNSYQKLVNCTFLSGMTVSAFDVVTKTNSPFGFIGCVFNGRFTGAGTAPSLFYVDSFTNYYLKNVASPTNNFSNATKITIGDNTP